MIQVWVLKDVGCGGGWDGRLLPRSKKNKWKKEDLGKLSQGEKVTEQWDRRDWRVGTQGRGGQATTFVCCLAGPDVLRRKLSDVQDVGSRFGTTTARHQQALGRRDDKPRRSGKATVGSRCGRRSGNGGQSPINASLVIVDNPGVVEWTPSSPEGIYKAESIRGDVGRRSPGRFHVPSGDDAGIWPGRKDKRKTNLTYRTLSAVSPILALIAVQLPPASVGLSVWMTCIRMRVSSLISFSAGAMSDS